MADEKSSLALQLGEQRGQLTVLQNEILKLKVLNFSLALFDFNWIVNCVIDFPRRKQHGNGKAGGRKHGFEK